MSRNVDGCWHQACAKWCEVLRGAPLVDAHLYSGATRSLPERTLVSRSVTWDLYTRSRTTFRGRRCGVAQRTSKPLGS